MVWIGEESKPMQRICLLLPTKDYSRGQAEAYARQQFPHEKLVMAMVDIKGIVSGGDLEAMILGKMLPPSRGIPLGFGDGVENGGVVIDFIDGESPSPVA